MNDERWAAVCDRDPRDDFVYAVRTTGVFCRPGCRARRPNRANVEFFDSGTEAQAAGYRACKRCSPGAPRAVDLALDRARDEIERNPFLTLAALGQLVGLSAPHLQRTFTARFGLSPKNYADACKVAATAEPPQPGARVLDAAFDTGFGSARAYYRTAAVHGRAPRRSRAGERIGTVGVTTDHGRALLAATDAGVCWIAFGDDDAALAAEVARRFTGCEVVAADDELQPLAAAFADHVRGTVVDIPLDLRGSTFQLAVWNALRSIPRGETRSYAAIAALIGRPTAARAVGRACATNEVAVLVPCHRAVRADGDVSDYRWGRDRKVALLRGERGD